MKRTNLLLAAFLLILFSTTAFAQIPSYVPTNGLVGWWPFNGNANDESGNGNNGTVNGATLTSDRFGNPGKAYDFDGVDDYIAVPHSSSLNLGVNDATFSLWYNLSDFNPNNSQLLLTKERAFAPDGNQLRIGIEKSSNASNKHSYFASAVNTNGLTWDINTGYRLQTIDTTDLNNWTHLLIIREGIKYYLYKDNIFQAIDSCTTGLIQDYTNNLQDLVFGARSAQTGNGKSEFYDGLIDDIGIWNRALTPEEILNLFTGCAASITTQPTNQTAQVASNAQLSVVSSDPSATFQWQTDLGLGYQNITNAGQYSGATTNTLTVSNLTLTNNNQVFRCIVSSGSCIDTSDVAVLTVQNPTGLIGGQLAGITLSPNPTDGPLNVTGLPEGSKYLLMDAQGRKIMHGTGSSSLSLDLSSLPEGVYMLSVEAQGSRLHGKVVVRK